ncbi:AraC family transcriptional regulator ligand-binding domain-containing protein [Marinobacterium arenosum]|uniref:AraC family transcriptional regulator ligand-binding domain-containing protein n=1 Tax=Marinobacterium arenosum TaxID=2862496 RepID=UPI001C96DADA|nr:AraC family transcriptional regulator ligand-binding domain-containing protein [Marinobacterium arenosum]MBY4679022.1 AraC family transcriptional regulator ligand-binding domain-containing protein [Marinobacterium arenosum]
MPPASALAKLLDPALQVAQHHQLEADRLLADCGLAQQELDKPGARFPAEHYEQLLQALATETANPRIALSLGEATQPRMLGSIGFLMATAATLSDAYQVLIDYLPLLFEGAALQMEQTLAGTRLTLELNRPQQKTTEYFLACLLNWPRWLTGRQVPALAVELAFPAPDDPPAYQRFFAAEVQFDAPRNQLLLASDYMAQRCLDANAEMHQLHREFADTLLSASAQQSALIARTRNQIRQQLTEGDGSVRREQVAAALNLSLRTLQRKLGLLGTNFQEIYDQTRRELCLQLILKGRLSFGEIAYRLGFSNQSAFQKAFKRWMGIPPSQYREQIKPAPPTPIDNSLPDASPTSPAWPNGAALPQQVSQRLRQLSDFSRQLLGWAALLGEQFELASLAAVTDNPLARLAIHLWPAQQLQLIQQDDPVPGTTAEHRPTSYRFNHPEIRQQLVDALGASEQAQRHRTTGLYLLAQLEQPASTLIPLLRALDHLNRGPSEQLPGDQFRLLAELNQQAAELAAAEQCFPQAAELLQQAIRWRLIAEPAQQPTTLQLQRAAALLNGGDTPQAEQLLAELSQTPLERAERCRLALLQAQRLRQQNHPEAALAAMLDAWRQDQQPLPGDDRSARLELADQLLSIGEQLDSCRLAELPTLHESQDLLQLALLKQIALDAGRLGQPLLTACAVSRMTLLSLQQGRSEYTAFAFVSYAWVCSWFCADQALAQTLSAQGLQLANEGTAAVAASANLIQGSQVQHWFAPLEQALDRLRQAERIGHDHGLWQTTADAQLIRCNLDWLRGQPLPPLQQQAQELQQQMRARQQPGSAQRLADSVLLLTEQLTCEQPRRLPPSEFSHGWQAVTLLMLALLLDRRQEWATLLSWEARLEQQLSGHYALTEALFCSGMMRLIQFQQRPNLSRYQRSELARLESRLELWSRQSPVNFHCQLELIRAEQLRLDHQLEATLQQYQQAIDAAEQQGFLHHRALCYERFADYLLSIGQRRLALLSLQQACALYRQWGALAKVKQLERLLNSLAQ